METQVALVDASNMLQNLGRPLTKVETSVPQLPDFSKVPGKVGGYSETTRVHRSVGLSDAGERFAMGRLESEVYPIAGPLCDMRNTNQVFGQPSRYDGRQDFLFYR